MAYLDRASHIAAVRQGGRYTAVIAGAAKQSILSFFFAARWIASLRSQ
jgi:hypothetical protein